MARVADHLSVEDLEARLRSAQDPTATRPFQVIWLLQRSAFNSTHEPTAPVSRRRIPTSRTTL